VFEIKFNTIHRSQGPLVVRHLGPLQASYCTGAWTTPREWLTGASGAALLKRETNKQKRTKKDPRSEKEK
jgi:hypothetical protein